jgi:transcriptional regulator of acetoin/glycerol metabolism
VSDGPKIGVAALTEELTTLAQRGAATLKFDGMTYREMLDIARDRATREYLVGLMKELGGNVTQAAERAGIERESMHRLFKKHGVRSEDFKPRG